MIDILAKKYLHFLTVLFAFKVKSIDEIKKQVAHSFYWQR